MAIRVSCPSCKADVHVDDALAGKDIICPSCRERMTVPSLASGLPEAKAGAAGGDQHDDDDRIREGGSSAGGLPRWDDRADFDLPRRHDSTRWNATLTGLGLIFWTSIISVIVTTIIVGLGLMMGTNQQIMFGAPGAQPRPEMMAMALVVSGLGCVLLILAIIAFVGMCMCCTVPSESGAKGRAITSVILVSVSVVMLIVFIVAATITTLNQVQRFGGPPPPGQMPFSPAMAMVIGVVAVLDLVLLTTLWLMFHKAIANYFHNARLSRNCAWFVVAFIVYEIGSVLLQFVANPLWQGGNMMAMPINTPWMIVAQIWGLLWMLGLSTWYLLIVRETRRTIQEDRAAANDDTMDDDRG